MPILEKKKDLSNLNFRLRNCKLKQSKKKEGNNNDIAEVNELKNRKTIEKIKTKSWFFYKTNKSGKL